MGRGGTALGIIGIILAAGAIGFTFVVWNGQNTTNSLTRTNVVGIWDSLADNQDYPPYNLQNDWLLEFGDNSFNNTDYVSVSNTNTRITLLKPGWYRIHLSVLLTGIDPNRNYRIRILKDGAIEFDLDFYHTALTVVSTYHTIDSSAFVYSDGTNYIELNGDANDDFMVPSNDLNNQLTIEFVTI
jgi:hypothetical protein